MCSRFNFLHSTFNFEFLIYKSNTSILCSIPAPIATIMSWIMWISNIAKIRLCTVAGYDFICKCCNCRCRLIWFQFTEYMALIVMRWCWTTSNKRKDRSVLKETYEKKQIYELLGSKIPTFVCFFKKDFFLHLLIANGYFTGKTNTPAPIIRIQAAKWYIWGWIMFSVEKNWSSKFQFKMQ